MAAGQVPTTSQSGSFCRDCGLAVFRATTGWCLTFGWLQWFSVVLVPLAVSANLGDRRRVAALRPPVSPALGRSPWPVGRVLWRRWQILGGLVPVVLILSVAIGVPMTISARHSAAKARVGQCLQITDDPPSVFAHVRTVPCSGPHDGVITQLVPTVYDCPAGTVVMTGNDAVYCVVRR